MKKLTCFLTLCFISVVIFTGCGQKAPKDQIVMWLVGSEAQSKNINVLAEKFAQETGIKVRCESISWGEAHSKYLTSIAGGVPPDIGTMGLTWSAEFGELGAMEDLNALYKDDVAVLKNITFPGIWQSVEYRDKIYGIPFDMTMHLVYYRKDIIPEAPLSWNDLTALLNKLKQEGKGMLFDWGAMEWIGYSPFLWQAGGDYFDSSYTQCTLDSQEALTGMKFFTDLYKVYNVPKTSIPLEQGMRTGDFPICISGNWKIIGLTVGAPEIMGKWSIAPLPKGPSGKSTAFIGGRVMGIFKQSKNKDKAWQFIKYLFKTESQQYLYKSSLETQDAYLPPNTGSWANLEMNPEFKRVLIAQALDSKGPPAVLGWDALTRYVDEVIQKVILKNTDPKTELKALKNLIDMERKKGM